MIQKLFHKNSRSFTEEGLYSLMFYKGRKAHVVHVDDQFFCMKNSRKHPYVKLFTDPKSNEREIWPMLVEKAYAKFHGNYKSIEGGFVSQALEELTNGFGEMLILKDKEVEEEYNTGELWSKLMYYNDKKYLMGCGTPAGSDSTQSSMGIVNGHAYSILDVCEIDGHKLMQLRNPWGRGVEWKGAWSDTSDMWTSKRKREAYARIKAKGGDLDSIGSEKEDGIFWMSFSDFYLNYAKLYLCRFFEEDYKEIYFESEWSVLSNTAGGCSNYDSVGQNPQMLLTVTSKTGKPLECFFHLGLLDYERDAALNKAIGFDAYDLGGKKVTDRRMGGSRRISANHAYRASVTLEEDVAPTGKTPLTLVPTVFEPGLEGRFRFTVYFKPAQGEVTLRKF